MDPTNTTLFVGGLDPNVTDMVCQKSPTSIIKSLILPPKIAYSRFCYAQVS
jgi:hypothetical protein